MRSPAVRQSRLHLDRVADHRDRRGRRWKLHTLLFSTLLGVMTGQKSFADVERLTANLSAATNRLRGVHRAVPDTTLFDALSTVDPECLRPVLHCATRSAHRSKSHSVDFDLPFGIVSMDGIPTVFHKTIFIGRSICFAADGMVIGRGWLVQEGRDSTAFKRSLNRVLGSWRRWTKAQAGS